MTRQMRLSQKFPVYAANVDVLAAIERPFNVFDEDRDEGAFPRFRRTNPFGRSTQYFKFAFVFFPFYHEGSIAAVQND